MMMFRSNTPAAAEPATNLLQGDPGPDHADLVPVSHLSLDLPDQSDWHAYLAGRNIEIVEDAIGRASIASGAARMLIAEECQRGQLRREKAAEAERLAVEADERFRAGLPKGLPWYELPDGVSFVEAAAAAEAAGHPRRTPTRGEWLFGETDTMVFHSLEGEDEAS
jgi:hypothetical protein